MLPLAFCCDRENDLYSAVSGKPGCVVLNSPEMVFENQYSGLLILADGYPGARTRVDVDVLERASEMGIRTYIEFPSRVPDLKVGEPAEVRWERGIIATDFFEPRLEAMSILDLHKCSYVPIDIPDPIMVLGRVAGLNRAVYGLPEEAHPLLGMHPRLDLLIGTTKLTNFATGRYSPTGAWRDLWQVILGWLTGGDRAVGLDWTPGVAPSYGREGPLPAEAEEEALERGLNWFINSGLLGGSDGGGGDGSSGLMEGFSSLINPDGSQTINGGLRADCNGEGAGALALGKIIRDDHPCCKISEKIIDYLFEGPVFSQGPRKDPESPSYGLISWAASPPADSIYYGDDNARCLLGMIEAQAVLGIKRFNAGILRCILANFRTTGSRGFRGWRLEEKDLQERGWRHYYRRRVTLFAPHYEAYLWACYLWAYRETGYRPFLTRARRAIELTMGEYPDGWKWTNGIAQERARMLLPLAWLVRVQDKPLHRDWLTLMGRDVIALQDETGALREELGGPDRGSYGPPRSNDDYGKHEATLMQKNGDPICDMLYTTNFAFLGLHEAAAATGDDLFIRAEDGLADFLCRIQIRSEKHPELDGAWYRGFDFSRWDYWGSNADAGWGVWSIESGWTQGWIVSVLGLRSLGESLWGISEDSGVKDHLDGLLDRMLS